MPLFGDASDATTFAVAMALISSVASFGTAYLAYRSGRDKLQYDSELVTLRNEVVDCEEDRKKLRDRMDRLEERFFPGAPKPPGG